jgi:hypothetical protein
MNSNMGFARWMSATTVLACLIINSAAATSPSDNAQSWRIEPGVSPPSYAWTEPTESEVNVDTVVLACNETAYGQTLELDLYLVGSEPLMPKGGDRARLKERPSVEIVIDGRKFHADLLFADYYVVVANASAHRWPTLSAGLLDAMQHGRSMVLRFDLMEDDHVGTGRFDSQLVIDLQAGQSAIASVRRCASKDAYVAAR